MLALNEVVGTIHGKLTILAVGYSKRRTRDKSKYRAITACECGNVKVIALRDINRPKGTRSCGCIWAEAIRKSNSTHGHSLGLRRSKEMTIHHNMMNRCYNENSGRYKNYGARGIVVCDRWHTFENFLADMGTRPEGRSLDRIDVNGDYCKDNCRWATREEQNANKTDSKLITYRGRTQALFLWCKELNLNYARTNYRLTAGWGVEHSFNAKVMK